MNKLITLLATVAATTLISATAALAEYTLSGERTQCSAYLTADDPDSEITLRAGPGTDYEDLGYGLVGDFVYILNADGPRGHAMQDRNGYSWFRVGFPESGQKGWIREDLLRIHCGR